MSRQYRPIQLLDAQGRTLNLDDDDLNFITSRAGTTEIRYIGYARPGSLTSEPAFLIKKYTYDSLGTIVRVRTATLNDTADYNNIWDNSTAIVISGITKAALAVVTTATDHGLSSGDLIEITGSDMLEVVGDGYGSIIFEVVYIDDTSFSMLDVDGVAVDSSGFASAATIGNVYARSYLNHIYA
jgi:hypothetical protein